MTSWKRTYPVVDEACHYSCRPDFSILVYPAYLVNNEEQNQTRTRGTGGQGHAARHFIHAGDDRVTADSSVQMWLAMRRAGVHSELHVFPGGHGYGLRPSTDPVSK